MRLWSCALIMCVSAQASAQTGGTAKTDIPANQLIVAANGVTARCMARTTTQSDGPNWQYVLPAPTTAQTDLAAKGFQPAACAGLALNLAKHKAMVCDLAKGNEAVQRRTMEVLGIDARKMCASAKLLVPDTQASN